MAMPKEVFLMDNQTVKKTSSLDSANVLNYDPFSLELVYGYAEVDIQACPQAFRLDKDEE